MKIKANKSFKQAIMLACQENKDELTKDHYELFNSVGNNVIMKIGGENHIFSTCKIYISREKGIWQLAEVQFIENGVVYKNKKAELMADFDALHN